MWQAATRSEAAGSVPGRWARPSAARRPPQRVSFWCANGHETRPSFADEARRSRRPGTARAAGSRPAGTGRPPAPPKTEPYKTHLAYVRERRNDADGEAILAEALAKRSAASNGRYEPRLRAPVRAAALAAAPVEQPQRLLPAHRTRRPAPAPGRRRRAPCATAAAFSVAGGDQPHLRGRVDRAGRSA